MNSLEGDDILFCKIQSKNLEMVYKSSHYCMWSCHILPINLHDESGRRCMTLCFFMVCHFIWLSNCGVFDIHSAMVLWLCVGTKVPIWRKGHDHLIKNSLQHQVWILGPKKSPWPSLFFFTQLPQKTPVISRRKKACEQKWILVGHKKIRRNQLTWLISHSTVIFQVLSSPT